MLPLSLPSYELTMTDTVTSQNIDLPPCINIEGDQKVSLHLMITIQKVTSNVQSFPRQSPDIY